MEPTTEAGRRLLAAVGGPPAPAVVEEWVRQEIAAIEAEAVVAERARITAGLEGLEATPYDSGDGEPDLCPNCVTPWKCNGPHVPSPSVPAGYDVDRADVLAIVNPEAGDE